MPKKLQRKVARKVPAVPARAAARDGGSRWLQSRRVSPRLLNEFTNQLAVLLDAGIPVTKCLRVLEGQLRPGPMKRALVDIREDVEGGASLSDSFAKHERIFDRLYTNMVAAGEAGGVQDVILNRLAAFMENQEDIKSRVRGALAYPIAVLLVAILVLILVFVYIIPQFKTIFLKQFNSLDDMPAITQFVINISEFVQSWSAASQSRFSMSEVSVTVRMLHVSAPPRTPIRQPTDRPERPPSFHSYQNAGGW